MGETDLACNSFGQNFNVTMMQMVAGFSSLINGGNYYKPHVVKQILNANGGVVENYDSELIKQTVTSDTSEFLKQALVRTVEAGTGKTAAVAGYTVGGKTGTAQHLDKTKDEYILSFLGFAPYDNPQVVCYVIVDTPDVDDKASSAYASKLFSAVMTEVLPYMNIFPTSEVNVSEEGTTETVTAETGTTEEGTTETPTIQTETEQTNGNSEEETTVSVSPSDDENYSEGGAFDDDFLSTQETNEEETEGSQ
jgi:stage V sporulation protein D (sporulation-specific penicillin-binding protein)